MEIVEIKNGEPTTTSLALAEGCKVQHKAVIQLVRQHLVDVEEFGRVTFEMRPFETAGGKQERELAILNERQSTLIMTYMKNGPVAREFKKRLVREFWDLVKLNEKSTSVMEEFANALQRMESDKDLASIHGKALSRWKVVRKEHIEAVTEAHSRAQLLLNFK